MHQLPQKYITYRSSIGTIACWRSQRGCRIKRTSSCGKGSHSEKGTVGKRCTKRAWASAKKGTFTTTSYGDSNKHKNAECRGFHFQSATDENIAKKCFLSFVSNRSTRPRSRPHPMNSMLLRRFRTHVTRGAFNTLFLEK